MDERETYLGEGSLLVRQVFADGFENGVSITVGLLLIANLPCSPAFLPPVIYNEGSQPPRYSPTGLPKKAARSWYLKWGQFGRYVEDVSFDTVDGHEQPTRLVMTAEMRTLYPEDRIPEPRPY